METYVPGERRGSCAAVSREREKVYMFRGYPTNASADEMEISSENHVAAFDFNTRLWSKSPFGHGSCNPPVDAGACGTIIGKYFYMFGGWQVGRLINSVHRLDLDSTVWEELKWAESTNQPLLKNKCGIVSYGDNMLCVFCGYGYPSFGAGLQKGASYDWERPVLMNIWIGWTNEIHLFHLDKRIWIVPEVVGTRPAPCAAFSYHYIDRHRVLMFGGRQKPERVNEVHILDMSTWHWTGAIIPSKPEDPWPIKRSLQTSFCLFDPLHIPIDKDKIVPREFPWLPCSPPTFDHAPTTSGVQGQKVFVLWGMDNSGDPVNDSWILDINTMSWTKVNLPNHLSPRIWHFSECIHRTPNQCLAMTFAGTTDNLFNETDEPTFGASKTLLFKFGISSLYEMCVNNVLELCTDISLLESVLPFYVYKNLCDRKVEESLIETVTV